MMENLANESLDQMKEALLMGKLFGVDKYRDSYTQAKNSFLENTDGHDSSIEELIRDGDKIFGVENDSK